MGLFLIYSGLMAYAVALLFPETRIGGLLKRTLIDGLAYQLNKLTLAKVIFAIALVAALVAFAPAFPAEVALLAAGDMAVYVEIMAIAMLSNAGARVVHLAHQMKAWVRVNVTQRLFTSTNRKRSVRSISIRRAKLNASDDENRQAPLTHPWTMTA